MIWQAWDLVYSAVAAVLYYFFENNSWDIIFFKCFFSFIGLFSAAKECVVLARTLLQRPRLTDEALKAYRKRRKAAITAEAKRPPRSLRLKLFYYVVPALFIIAYGSNLRQRVKDWFKKEEEQEVPYIR